MRRSFRLSHTRKPTNSPAFAGLFPQEEAVKPPPRARLAGFFRYRQLAPSTFLALCSRSFGSRLQRRPAGFRKQAVICRLILAPVQQPRLPPFARPSASSISATDHISTFVVCNRPLLDWNSRPNRASESILQPFPFRRSCGFQSNVSGINLLPKIPAVKLRLERFRTSHARVGVNLLF